MRIRQLVIVDHGNEVCTSRQVVQAGIAGIGYALSWLMDIDQWQTAVAKFVADTQVFRIAFVISDDNSYSWCWDIRECLVCKPP